MSRSKDSGMIPPPTADGPSAPGGHTTRRGTGPVNPAALTVAQMARMLGVPEETIRRHVAAGAPVGSDGTVNLVNYAAWLNKELAKDDGD